MRSDRCSQAEMGDRRIHGARRRYVRPRQTGRRQLAKRRRMARLAAQWRRPPTADKRRWAATREPGRRYGSGCAAFVAAGLRRAAVNTGSFASHTPV